MHKAARKISRVFIMEYNRAIQYRVDLVLWMLAETSVPLISLAIWYNVAGQASTGPSQQQVLTYYLAVLVTKIISDAWVGAFLAQEILDGSIVKALLRPLGTLWYHIANNIIEKAMKLILPVIVLTWLLIQYRYLFTTATYQISTISLFVISLILAATMQFILETILAFLAFWFEDVMQLRRYKVMLDEIASGILIPLSFLPAYAVTFLNFLPFRYIIAGPAEIISGQTVGLAPLSLIAIQLIWIVALIACAIVLWRLGLRRYAIPGQ